MLEPFSASFINRLLRDADWARDALKPYAGFTARFETPPFAATFTVLDAGEVTPARSDAPPAVTIRVTPGVAMRIAGGDERAWNDVQISGDAGFAEVIHHLARHLRWDIEEDLSRLFGDVAGHRMAQTGRSLRQWAGDTLDHAGRALSEYWVHERPLIAGRLEIEDFNESVDTLRDDVARFEKRLEASARRMSR